MDVSNAIVEGEVLQSRTVASAGSIQVPTVSFEGPTVSPVGAILRKHGAAKLPTLPQALAQLRSTVAAQDPRDFSCPVGELRMNAQGKLYREGKDPKTALAISHSALQQALSFLNVPRNSCAVMEYVDAPTRAAMLYDMVKRASRDASEPLILRTISLGGRRFVRAVVTETHSQETGDDLVIADALESLMQQGVIDPSARARVVRDLHRTDVEIILVTQSYEVRKGDIVFAKLHTRNSETKHAGFEANGGLHRLVCLNGMTRADDDGSSVSVRHVGEMQKRIRRAIQVAGSHLEDFAQAFRASYEVPLPKPRAEVLEIAGKRLELPESTLSFAAQLWDADQSLSAGNTLAGLVNALTRASQEGNFSDAERIEKGAGELVMRGLGVLGLA